MKTIAGFFTGGYTESDAMILFLQRINSSITFKQCCPNRPRRRKASADRPELKDNVSGLTGQNLINYMYEYFEKYPDELRNCIGVLIEDDLDGKFYEEDEGPPKTPKAKKNIEYYNYIKDVEENVRQRLNKEEDFLVIQLYAAPEIEAWMISDWENSFGKIYGPHNMNILTAHENSFFSTLFRGYVKDRILMQYKDSIEEYGYFGCEYRKMSDELISGLQEFKVEMSENTETEKKIKYNQNIYYSKQLHGDVILRELNPDLLVDKCPRYFAEVYRQIKAV